MTRSRVRVAVQLAALAGALAACPPKTEPTPDGGPCDGQVGCACLAGNTCRSGECVSGSCVDCRRGEAACSCRSNATCNAGLRCTAERCETCPAAELGCPCGAGDTCAVGATCTAGTCTPSTCTAGARGCPCRGAAPRCDGTDTCDPSMVCRACGPDIAGCPCGSGNTCQGGLTCDVLTGACRAPVTCMALKVAGTCPLHQACNEAPGVDATCVPAMCEADWKWDVRTNSCVACVTPGCASEPSCAAGDAGDACEAAHRLCLGGSTPYCGACQPGFTENASMQCVAGQMCGGRTCTASEYCDTSSGMAACLTLPCPAGQAKNSMNLCVACMLSCNTAGYTGRVWPIRDGNNQCLCETLPDWFIPGGGSGLAAPCDADGDGWVNTVSENISDPQWRANARCTVRKVDRVKLVDELGTALSLRSCAVGGMLPEGADGGACAAVLPLPLLETQRNDVPGLAIGATFAPLYGTNGGADGGLGGTGRYLEARELNGLTKACVSPTAADYNNNGVDDMGEVAPAAPVDLPAAARLAAFSYFLELHESYFEAPVDGGSPYGTLVIRERSRCGLDFPLHYDPAVDPAASSPADRYVADAGATYWRNCDRRRDPAFDVGLPNFDFAQWSCPGSSGSCLYVGPAHATKVAPVNPATDLMRGFGACELGGGAPADGLWRGMGHHSQFKCVSVVAGSPSANGYDVALSEVAPSGRLTLSSCAARPCASASDPGCSQAQGPGGAQTRRPVVDCRAQGAGVAGAVGFAAVKYQPYGPAAAGYPPLSAYAGGCVNEDVENQPQPPVAPAYLTLLCPYPEYNNVYSPVGVTAAAQRAKSSAAFGRYSCFGDAPNFLWGPGLPDGGSERATLRWASGFWR